LDGSLRILKIIHGYPPLFNAGSEVYSRTLCHGLVDHGYQVAVFTRFEDPFIPDYEMDKTYDPLKPSITLYRINMARDRDRYRHETVDQQLKVVILKFKPDIVHIGHLNHLSTSMIEIIKEFSLPIIFTLHDYWLMCPRGQFLQTGLGESELWRLCDNQEDKKCASMCYSRYFSGHLSEMNDSHHYWTDWIHRRMEHIKKMVTKVDRFIAPSKHLMNRFTHEYRLPKDKVTYLDYGFELQRFKNRNRFSETEFVFGYIGTHIPAKGIDYLLQAYDLLEGKAKLRIWGRSLSQNTSSLSNIAKEISDTQNKNIEWIPEYKNEDIVEQVFNHVDAIVVPSIWDENSPLVIKEAQQAKVPVITANYGGMQEYVAHKENGLLFEHRNFHDLAKQMQKFVENPIWAKKLGNRGYLYSKSGDIPSIEEHVSEIVNLYEKVLGNSK